MCSVFLMYIACEMPLYSCVSAVHHRYVMAFVHTGLKTIPVVLLECLMEPDTNVGQMITSSAMNVLQLQM